MAAIGLVVLDWAGTSVDHGCFAPVAGFIEAFARHGIEVTEREAREPMGLHKRDHLRAMLSMPEVSARWRAKHGRDGTEKDVEQLFDTFMPLQLEVIEQHTQVIPGLVDSIEVLRTQNIRIGGTTGYFHDAATRVYQAAQKQGYQPDYTLCPEDGVPAGRPAPWMMFRIMERLDVYPPHRVVKVGDTVHDIAEGRNAGVWSVGVLDTGSPVGLSAEAWRSLSEQDRQARRQVVTETLRTAGADAVIRSVADLPGIVEELSTRVVRGERPGG